MRTRHLRMRSPAGRRLVAPGGGAFNPTMVAGLALWLDPTFGLFQERTGASATTPAAADGDPVGTWAARAGGVYLTAPSDAGRPTLQTVAGQRVIRFDGVDDALNGGSVVDDWTALSHAVYAQVIANNIPTLDDGVIKTHQQADGWRIMLASTGGKWGTYSGAEAPANTVLVVGTRYVLGINGGTFRLNGADDGVYVGSIGDATQVDNYVVGNRSLDYSDFDLGQLVAYRVSVTGADRAALEGYLTW